MLEGDIVKWIGFPGADPQGVKITAPACKSTGIVIKIYEATVVSGRRLDVLWADGSIGKMLYPETIEVVNED